MFNNLIESRSHGKEFKRRGSFVLVITAGYALLFFAAGVASIYAYDARLEAQKDDLALLSWVPPLTTTPVTPARAPQPVHKAFTPTATVDKNITTPERVNPVSTTNDPLRAPDVVGVKAGDPPVTTHFVVTGRNADPPAVSVGDKDGCLTCPGNGTGPVVKVDTLAPEPTPRKPTIERVSSFVLRSHAINLPQPPYPQMAKQIHLQGAVVVQILVDETGRVVSAQVLSGHPILGPNAKEAALRASFTPTMLNNQPVKVQGVITYNFVLQ